MLYPIFLSLHSILRWFVLIVAILAIIRAITGLSFRRGYTTMDNRAGLWYTILLDIQVLIGIILYFFLSPITMSALQDFGGAMGNTVARYFLVEHTIMMIIALGVAHMGRVLARKASNAAAKHRRTLIWFSLSLLLVLASIPWPFLPVGRPLLRFFGL
jgi:uncharacterized membrane protein YozB (DUF420 family)